MIIACMHVAFDFNTRGTNIVVSIFRITEIVLVLATARGRLLLKLADLLQVVLCFVR